MPEPSRCPSCGPVPAAAGDRFCPSCGLPLVLTASDDPPLPDAWQERARKIERRYSEGPLVAVARGRNQTEADFIAGLLLEEGIPSLIRRSRGFDVPDMLAAGPRDVLVPRSGEEAARQVLLQADLHGREADTGPAPAKVAAGLLLAVAAVGLIVWLGWLLS